METGVHPLVRWAEQLLLLSAVMGMQKDWCTPEWELGLGQGSPS